MISLSKSEKSYIRSGILSNPPSRADGRSLQEFRNIALETGVASLANGSARVSIGRGTEVIAATKLEVVEIGTDDDDNDNDNDNDDQGRIVCSVSCSPSAYPHLTSPQLEDLQSDLTTLLHTTLSHPTLHPKNLGIIKGRKSWKLHLDVLVLVDSGNILDTIFLASRAALWDTKVPRTRAVEYRAPHTQATSSSSKGKGKQSSNTDSAMDVDGDVDPEEKVEEKDAIQSGFDTRALNRKINRALDFELPDYWDEGEVLDGRSNWPVGITINLESSTHFLDATSQEEAAIPLKLLLVFSFSSPNTNTNPDPSTDDSSSSKPQGKLKAKAKSKLATTNVTTESLKPTLQAMRMLGSGELTKELVKEVIKEAEKYALALYEALNVKLREEDVRRGQKAREKFEGAR